MNEVRGVCFSVFCVFQLSPHGHFATTHGRRAPVDEENESKKRAGGWRRVWLFVCWLVDLGFLMI